MFLKITKAGGYEYAKIVHNYRENGKIKQKVLFNLGRIDELKNDPSFINLVDKLQKIFLSSSEETGSIKLFPEDVSEGIIKNWGYIVYRKLWEELEIDRFLKQYISQNSRIKFDIDKVAFLMTVQRLIQPVSKLQTYYRKNRYFGFEEDIDLNQLYRGLDILAQIKEDLELYLYHKNRDLFNMVVDVVFYDVTTFYFESIKQDDLRDFGFSKDNKVNEVQVVMGMLVDKEGRPVGYELFPGDTVDSKTMIEVLRKLKDKFCIDQVIIVADKGLNSKLNLKLIKEAGYDYIVASRLKNMSKEILDRVFDEEGYQVLEEKKWRFDREIFGEEFRFKVIERENIIKTGEGEIFKIPENLIITYSSKRAKKDKEDRQRLVEKAKELLERPGNVRAAEKRGGRKYLRRISESEEYVLDEEAIKRDEKFDGFYAIQTSKKEMSVTEVLNAYHDLWKIEQSFRVMKSCLKVRPIFHWTEKRIRGHFVVCYLAFLLERTLEYSLRAKWKELSSDRIKEAIGSMNFVEIEINGKKYLIKQKIEEEAEDILKVMKIKAPKNFITYEEGMELISMRK
ncbi:transposase [Caldanaerobacter subterraneus subsp. tengcongensis MB4]|uniref:Transposase n=2 Tax=Caldanaerobacter subterraneus TaxID=911092 RepID=Q8R6J9_CALS4|nr:IS1634 family transposase [Caldanaerobacter subterraneus]AAM25266.1 transposase [Caldanaerobacter subterraneus subsp. tengcongensis MB4]AAM25647.1 transposase [Caldanaerobacter subterraneus subsp. tengcongensis MB4]MCS3915138.1 transposase [Caldanaerobacter subterraneus subsp. tengcongensis MB4]MCS3917480.1 transposase [Caldanaerobacter subterraneus subsp. tengcongensis MB4]